MGRKPNRQGAAHKWLLAALAVCSACKDPVRSTSGETHPTVRVDGSGSAPNRRYHAYRCANQPLMRNGDILIGSV